MKNWWVYVLKLEEGKYYVGITSKTPEQRFKEHQNGFFGANWTKKYKPVKILDSKNLGEVSREEAEAIENVVTRKYMEDYGYNNVRGGDLTASEKYFKRFNRYVEENDWKVMTIIMLLITACTFLLIDKYFI